LQIVPHAQGLARLHQLGAFFAIFMASDCDKPLESQGWDSRKAL